MANITIDNINLEVNEGEYILEIARKNNIFIPAICYLTKCSPTLACKLCMVEIDGKRSYACNTKAKEGMNITTNTPDIAAERKAIMQSYVVNHPLECGVCDKSGECELQDFTHLFNVDSQDFFIPDSKKDMAFWSQVKYDPSLCILCERCVTTCKDNLGEANIKSVKYDAIPLDATYWKEKMPKDAFSVWNRKQKGLIGFVGENPCFDCAECVSVCPVGALGLKSFQYSTNAWELNKISSTCALCSSGCKIVYESKKDSNGESKIYRVTNDFNFNPICGAGRFAYDIYPTNSTNNLTKALESIKKADYIVVGGNTTNNEALFLNEVKKKFNIKLVNPLLKKYSDFMGVFFSSGAKISTLEDISKHKVVLSFGSSLKNENPLVRYKINNTAKIQKDIHFIYAHPLKDKLIQKLSKNFLNIQLKPQSEDILLLAILDILDSNANLTQPIKNSKKTIEYKTLKENISQIKEIIKDENGDEKEVSKEIKEQVESIEHRDYYAIFEDAGISYEVYLALESALQKSKPLLIVGSDVYFNPNANYIAKILSYLQINLKADVLIIPPTPNANGLCNIIDFNSDASGFSVGFRTKGDYVFDSVLCDFEIPYFNALNDTITNIDYKILPLQSAFKINDYLSALAKGLDISLEIPDLFLNNDFGNDGRDLRGIKTKANIKNSINDINFTESASLIDSGLNAYLRDSNTHFYPYTKYSKNLQCDIGIYTSKQNIQSLNLEYGINEGDNIKLIANDNEISAKIYVDYDMEDDYFAVSPQISGADAFFRDCKYLKVRVGK